MDAGVRHRRIVTAAGSAALAGAAAVQLRAFWPGIMVWDAIRQYRQALSGHYDDWHPPAMNWLWRQLLPIAAGPAPMLVVQALLYWAGFAMLGLAALRRGRTGLAVALGLCALLPIPYVLVGAVLKDSLMAGALLSATGLLALCRPQDRIMRVAGIALLIGAATLRFNAVPACLPLFVALLPAGWRDTRRRLMLACLGAGLPLVAALPVANALLEAAPSDVSLSLIVYDLGGITRMSGVDAFPPQPVADPVGVNAHCYTPVSWDRYAWWGDDPCPIGFASVRTALATSGQSGTRLWLGAILAHPIAYAAHRLAHFNDNVRFLVRDADLPVLSRRSDPNPWGFQVLPSRLRDRLDAVAAWSVGTPLGWPACWLALGLAILILTPASRAAGPILPVTLSAVLYGFSYLPLSVASEVRYHMWTASGIAIAAMLAGDALRRGPRIARWRITAAAALSLAAIAVSVGWRLAG